MSHCGGAQGGIAPWACTLPGCNAPGSGGGCTPEGAGVAQGFPTGERHDGVVDPKRVGPRSDPEPWLAHRAPTGIYVLVPLF